ncbi:response regulator receiver protein [Nitritalea halalkaliphila LW7]|uniref:Response regulator receiver protein n=1 Tax=Nitritalea halalkaliphila LW7 TaxID=1189621 RepID=I5C1X7_9BACT|nr:sugar transferase [Nitritalea halalkaliphila]EIM75829.1 response regulator receiver protein [Nitritalea halalkaliphila LW7]
MNPTLAIIRPDLLFTKEVRSQLAENYQLAEEFSIFSFIEKLKAGKLQAVGVCLFGKLSDPSFLNTVETVSAFKSLHAFKVIVFSDMVAKEDRGNAVRLDVDGLLSAKELKKNHFLQVISQALKREPSKLREELTDDTQTLASFDYKTPLNKRLFDIFFSGLALLLLSPILLTIAALIRLESKGPIFYKSKRVGTAWKVIDFYKFRSMVPDADKKLKSLDHLNQYKTGEADQTKNKYINKRCDTCLRYAISCEKPLFNDSGDYICETFYPDFKKESDNTFFKIANDPRITKLGAFLRNSSIDELPQLINVFIGDMSIVGNRPLPIYEAEKLTTDKYSKRFMAPSGITGLWQVTKRGKGGPMSEEERIALDNYYADNFSFWLDMKIILKTFPALFQKESV